MSKLEKGYGSTSTRQLLDSLKTYILTKLAEKADVSSLGTASTKNIPVSGDASTTQVVMGNDSRLSDARPASNVTNSYSPTGTAPVSGKAVAEALSTVTRRSNVQIASASVVNSSDLEIIDP